MSQTIEQRVRDAFDAPRQAGFAPGFEERALARWERYRHGAAFPTTGAIIEQRARQLLPFALAASLLLGLYSASATGAMRGERHGTVVERVLGLEPVTFDVVYEAIYQLPLAGRSAGGR